VKKHVYIASGTRDSHYKQIIHIRIERKQTKMKLNN